jgi:hypothetical protein
MKNDHPVPEKQVGCCPDISEEKPCNILDFQYRLTQMTRVRQGNSFVTVPVEVIVHARLEICTGGLSLGKLAYSTTLLPGEKVRLFTSDRRSQFTFDSESSLSYRHQQTYEEQFYLTSMNRFMSDLTVTDRNSGSSSSKSHVDASVSARGAIESFFAGPGGSASGNYSGSSSFDFLRELRQHAESSHYRSEQATRSVNAVQVGEVNTRTHVEGQSEDHFESSSRQFSNPNRCHAITYYFYQLNQQQTVKFSIVSIRRRVVDPAGDSKVANNDFVIKDVSAIPSGIPAISTKRLELEKNAVLANRETAASLNVATGASLLSFNPLILNPTQQTPLAIETNRLALAAVTADLTKAGLVNPRTGELTDEVKQELTFEITTSLPTAGMLVRGCLDDCDVCEELVKKQQELELTRMSLENDLLKRKIELLDKAQEYRCCPVEEEELA